MSNYVQVINTPTTNFIKIIEPGGQSKYKNIQCTLEEARDIFLELAEILEEEIKKGE